MPDNLYSDGGAFIPSSYVWDIQEVKKLPEEEFRLLLVRLYQNVNNIALVLNIKDSGFYNTSQFVNGQVFFPNPALNSTTPQAGLQDRCQLWIIAGSWNHTATTRNNLLN